MKRPLIAAALAASLLATPALAASDKFEVALTFDRTALDTPQDARAEYDKLHEEVAERCTAEHADFPLGRDLAVTLCTARTMNTAVKTINHPRLTEVHAARMAG